MPLHLEPGGIPQNQIKSTLLSTVEDVGKGELPVEETVLLRQFIHPFQPWEVVKQSLDMELPSVVMQLWLGIVLTKIHLQMFASLLR